MQPLPQETSPEYYLRLANLGPDARAILLWERYRPADRRLPRHLQVLYGAALLDKPELQPAPAAVTAALGPRKQDALDEVDRLYLPLDEVALHLAQLGGEAFDAALREYAARVAADSRLARHPLHRHAPAAVREATVPTLGLGGYWYADGWPQAAAVALLTAVVAQARERAADIDERPKTAPHATNPKEGNA